MRPTLTVQHRFPSILQRNPSEHLTVNAALYRWCKDNGHRLDGERCFSCRALFDDFDRPYSPGVGAMSG